MNRVISSGVLVLAMVSGLWGQQVKSQGEAEALQAVFKTTTADERIKAAQAVLVKYADTQFKPLMLLTIAQSYQMKNDNDNVIVYAERVLKEGDPKSYEAMLMLAESYAQRTREFDLDKEEKLTKADKFAKDALESLKTATKPNPQITDEQWNGLMKENAARAHQALGLSAMVRKKYDVAITEFKMAVEGADKPDPATQVRLASAYDAAGKYDDALAILDKLMAQSDLHPSIRQFAQAERVRAMQGKGGGAKPATPPGATPAATPATPPPAGETKKP
jgi:tetratricopeptide (TPR) repeat protein